MKYIFISLLVSLSTINYAMASPLDIEADYVSKYCDDNFALYEFRFSNSTQDWVEIDTVSLNFNSESADNTVSIVVGSQLAFWQEAQELQERENNIKLSIFFGAIGVLGAASNSNLGDVAAFAAGAGLTAQGLDKLQDKYRGSLVPKNHLLSGKIIVPPNLAIKRWVLLYSDNKTVNSFVKELMLKLYDNNEELMSETVDIRSDKEGFLLECQWQKPITPSGYKPTCANIFDPRCR